MKKKKENSSAIKEFKVEYDRVLIILKSGVEIIIPTSLLNKLEFFDLVNPIKLEECSLVNEGSAISFKSKQMSIIVRVSDILFDLGLCSCCYCCFCNDEECDCNKEK